MLTGHVKSHWKYWHGYVSLFIEEDLNFGLTLGSCVMTLPLNMMHSKSMRFWPKKGIIKLDHLLFLWDVAAWDFWLLPELKTALTRPQIFRHCLHSGTYDLPSWRAFQKINFLSCGKTVSPSILLCKETALKVTGTTSLRVIKYSLYRNILGTQPFFYSM